jgi:tRNA(Ile2) C34 agmatinyltransferase TiaS
MSRKPVTLSKEELRAQSERAMKEAMERKLVIKQLDTRKEAKCGKCGGTTRVNMEAGKNRTQFKCKECGHSQMTL